jgi:hypothetical protein
VATNSTVVGGTGLATVQFSSSADLVSLSGTFGAGSLAGGAGADTLVFLSGAEISTATSVLGGSGADSILFNGNTLSGIFAGGVDADLFSGSVTIGASGVSFWGGSGNDTFNFSIITGRSTASTAYFWNDAAGTDSLVFNSVISGGAGSGYAAAIFGISVGLSSATALDISFAAGQTTNLFGANAAAGAFFLGSNASTLVSFGFGSSSTTIIFNGGNALATLQGGAFETSTGTLIFTNATVGSGGTANFGIASAIPTFS